MVVGWYLLVPQCCVKPSVFMEEAVSVYNLPSTCTEIEAMCSGFFFFTCFYTIHSKNIKYTHVPFFPMTSLFFYKSLKQRLPTMKLNM